MGLYQIIYRSKASRPLGDAELKRLASQASIYNYSESITGVLFYDGTHFLQLLEGRQDTVEQLYSSIMDDPRHTEVTMLFSNASPQRLFPHWSMAVSCPAAEALERLIGFLNPWNQLKILPKGYNKQEVNSDLLQEFIIEYPPRIGSGAYRSASLR